MSLVVNPEVDYPANATDQFVELLRGQVVAPKGMAAGRYAAIWLDPQTGRKVGTSLGFSDGALLSLPLPQFSEDLAGYVRRVNDFSLDSPERRADGSFAAVLRGDTGQIYGVEISGDLTQWQPLVVLTSSSLETLFQDPAAAGTPRRFYRARLSD